MNRLKELFSLSLLVLFIGFSACSDGDDKQNTTIQKSSLSGVVEKGPFVNGSTVTIYELTENLAQTGKTFNATTDNEGHFELTNSMEFVSDYVKLTVNGFYFNEITGELSNAPITLEALVNIKNKNSLNANLLTHLEAKRVIHLIDKEKMNFDEAKKRAENELLACFLIKNKTIIPEAASITANNTDANILIAISSILLRTIEVQHQADAQFTELINGFRDDFATDGEISEQLKEVIKTASYKLNYREVKENIEKRYSDLGKNISVGNFHYFIDGRGNGELSEDDYPVESITEETFFSSEEDFQAVLTNTLSIFSNVTKEYYWFDALFTNITTTETSDIYINDIYNHRITPHNSWVNSFYRNFYRAISQENIIIEKGLDSKPEFKKYAYASIVYRACKYLTMTDLWGDTPLVITPPSLETAYLARTPQKEIYNQIIKDLEAAGSFLDATGNYMVCSKYLAYAILARAYMQMKDFPNALLYANLVIQSGKYSLCLDYNDIFKPGNTETIFSFLSTEQDSFFFNELIKKGTETPIIRYAEILLIAAEANMKSGNNDKAIELLNKVRDRNKRELLASDTPFKTIEVALLEEWSKDLEKEGVWFSTLKRFGIAEDKLQIPSYMKLLPIPQSEIDLNPNATQNPGY